MKGDRDIEAAESQAWYLAEGARGQQMLDEGRAAEAMTVFAGMLDRIGDGPSFGRAVILGRLGRCCFASGEPARAVQLARDAIGVVGVLAPSDGVKGLRATLRSELGDALRAAGQYSDARKAYEAALKIAGELNDIRAQGVELGHLGAIALAEGRLQDALTCQQAALGLFQQIDEPDMEAAAWHQLGKVYHKQTRWEEAERHYREAGRISEKRGRLASAAHTFNQLAVLAADAGKREDAEAWCRRSIELARRAAHPPQLRHGLDHLARLLLDQPGRLSEARQFAEEALAVAQQINPAAAEGWSGYGVLADIADMEASITTDEHERALLAGQARDFREVQGHAPAILVALDRMGAAPSYGRAVMLGQLGRCFFMARRPDLAVACHRDAIGVTGQLDSSDDVEGTRGMLQSDLGDMLAAIGQDAAAAEAHTAALRIAERMQDLRGQAHNLQRLGRVFEQGRHRIDAAAFTVTRFADLLTDYVFGTDLLIDGPRQRRIMEWDRETPVLADGVQPMLPPGTRLWTDDEGTVHFKLPQPEPVVVPYPECTSIRRMQPEVTVSGPTGVLWRLVAEMDGPSTVAEIQSRISADQRAMAARLLAALAATGVIDVSGRTMGQFIHSATKKGVLPAGGLEGDAVLRLATDGNYRAYPDAVRIAVSHAVPEGLRSFHQLTRSRRSRRDYDGRALGRRDFDALLHTACGVTGAMPWDGRDVKLRAYPSSGALYSVEIYPIVFRVAGLEPAVYHYRAVEHVLEVVRPAIDPAVIMRAALPVEREMMTGAAALFCLAGCFPRHERKYGQGGYRMLVAEAGHISMNLVLAATALGVSARPFGGVFDDLLNRELGLAHEDEQFLLAVVVGHAGGDT